MIDALGRRVLERSNKRGHSGFLVLTYQSRALEWVNIRQLFVEMLTVFSFDSLIQTVQDIVIAWKYHDNLATILYKPASVFKLFSFLDLLDVNQTCACSNSKRLQPFLDPLTLGETS